MFKPEFPSNPATEKPSRTAICFFSSVASFDTGMPVCTEALIRHFAHNSAYEVFAILPENGEFAHRLSEASIPVTVIPFARARSFRRGVAFFRFFMGLPVALVRIYLHIRHNRFAIVHFSDVIDTPFYPCAMFAGAKVVAHVRRTVETRVGRTFFRTWTWLWANAVVCISGYVQRHCGVPFSRARVVYDAGPDPQLFVAAKEYLRPAFMDPDRQTVVTIAKFLHAKGHEHFIKMAALCERAAPGTMQFVIVGDKLPGHEGYYNAMIHLIATLGLGSQVTIAGQMLHEDIPAVLAHSAVLAHLPNYQEGLGAAILEAMAMSVPIVAFDSGGVGECFKDGEHGFLIRQYDAAAAAAKVLLLCSDEKLRKRLGDAAARYCAALFSRDKHFAGIAETYASVLAGTSR
jgi:glycosyltransferase involved in cell wall biosynthesis